MDFVETNKHIFKVFHHRVATPNMTIFRRELPNVGIECTWGRQKLRFWLHCVLWTVPVASAVHLAATDIGEFIALVAGKRPSLLMAGNNVEVYDKKPQRYAEDNVTQW